MLAMISKIPEDGAFQMQGQVHAFHGNDAQTCLSSLHCPPTSEREAGALPASLLFSAPDSQERGVCFPCQTRCGFTVYCLYILSDLFAYLRLKYTKLFEVVHKL